VTSDARSPRPAPRARPARARGFTLIEITLVLLIIGVLLSLAAPKLSLLGQARLDASARRLAAMISYLNDEAALRGRVYRLTLELDESRYTIETQAPYARGEIAEGFVTEWDPYAEPTELPLGIRIVRVESADRAALAGPEALYFLPEGGADTTTITLEGDDGRRLDVWVDGPNDRVEVRPVPARP
jgi:type II secretion system protein H